MDASRLTTAGAIADHFGLDAKSYRARLRREALAWHAPGERWIVSPGSPEQHDMLRLARAMRD